ncbi:hypothetical protein EDD29_7648 [Actinocorallia herbida]|uniref:Uncharacterized protein n=1 Tax=Actinocorallia herbida TaxID=58109 RepID=A0A3N1D8R4_9ACTN|nr:hypothetical protein EDD29_7648 [Actinocorallia herbida]
MNKPCSRAQGLRPRARPHDSRTPMIVAPSTPPVEGASLFPTPRHEAQRVSRRASHQAGSPEQAQRDETRSGKTRHDPNGFPLPAPGGLGTRPRNPLTTTKSAPRPTRARPHRATTTRRGLEARSEASPHRPRETWSSRAYRKARTPTRPAAAGSGRVPSESAPRGRVPGGARHAARPAPIPGTARTGPGTERPGDPDTRARSSVSHAEDTRHGNEGRSEARPRTPAAHPASLIPRPAPHGSRFHAGPCLARAAPRARLRACPTRHRGFMPGPGRTSRRARRGTPGVPADRDPSRTSVLWAHPPRRRARRAAGGIEWPGYLWAAVAARDTRAAAGALSAGLTGKEEGASGDARGGARGVREVWARRVGGGVGWWVGRCAGGWWGRWLSFLGVWAWGSRAYVVLAEGLPGLGLPVLPSRVFRAVHPDSSLPAWPWASPRCSLACSAPRRASRRAGQRRRTSLRLSSLCGACAHGWRGRRSVRWWGALTSCPSPPTPRTRAARLLAGWLSSPRGFQATEPPASPVSHPVHSDEPPATSTSRASASSRCSPPRGRPHLDPQGGLPAPRVPCARAPAPPRFTRLEFRSSSRGAPPLAPPPLGSRAPRAPESRVSRPSGLAFRALRARGIGSQERQGARSLALRALPGEPEAPRWASCLVRSVPGRARRVARPGVGVGLRPARRPWTCRACAFPVRGMGGHAPSGGGPGVFGVAEGGVRSGRPVRGPGVLGAVELVARVVGSALCGVRVGGFAGGGGGGGGCVGVVWWGLGCVVEHLGGGYGGFGGRGGGGF